MKQMKVSDYIHRRLEEIKSDNKHTSFDSVIRELLYSRKSSHYHKMAIKAKERDGFECRRCGKTELEEFDDTGSQLSIHHITPRKKFDDMKEAHKLDNLVTLCRKCHMTVESNGWGLESINNHYETYVE